MGEPERLGGKKCRKCTKVGESQSSSSSSPRISLHFTSVIKESAKSSILDCGGGGRLIAEPNITGKRRMQKKKRRTFKKKDEQEINEDRCLTVK